MHELAVRLREWAAKEAMSGADMPWAALGRRDALTRSQTLLWVADYIEGKRK